MRPNMIVHLMVVKADSKTLDARAADGWHVEHAIFGPRWGATRAAVPGRWAAGGARVRRAAGVALVWAGARRQGVPRPAPRSALPAPPA